MQQANAGGDREGGDREAEKKKRPILPETSYQKPWLGGSDGTTSHCQTAEKRQAPAPQPGRGASVTFARFTPPPPVSLLVASGTHLTPSEETRRAETETVRHAGTDRPLRCNHASPFDHKR